MFFFGAVYFLSVYVYKIWKKRNGITISISQSRHWLNGLIKKIWVSWTQPPEPPEPLASEIFISTLKSSLSEISAIEVSFIPHKFGLDYSGHGIPFVDFSILSRADTTMIEFACQKLEEVAKNFLVMSNYQSPLVWAHFIQYGKFRYYIVLFYAVFPATQERLLAFKRAKAIIQEAAFSRENQPVINPDLERELADMETEDNEDET